MPVPRSLIGPPGQKGVKGDQGDDGTWGIRGPTGDPGLRGNDGISGSKGNRGTANLYYEMSLYEINTHGLVSYAARELVINHELKSQVGLLWLYFSTVQIKKLFCSYILSNSLP